MKVRLTYKEPGQNKASLAWLQRAEDELNHTMRKKLEEYAMFGVEHVFVAQPKELNNGQD